MKELGAFLLGAALGAAVVALCTPMNGKELRERIKAELRKRGIIQEDQIEQLTDIIQEELSK
jgi:gas vesicle protein